MSWMDYVASMDDPVRGFLAALEELPPGVSINISINRYEPEPEEHSKTEAYEQGYREGIARYLGIVTKDCE